MKELYKLDNAAKLFVSIKNKKNIPIFRVSALLKDKVNEATLQNALDITMKRFPTFALSIKKGLFWNYFEENNRRILVEEEKYYPCYNINYKLNNGYLVRVVYYKYRISVEIFHSLADATALISFLKSLLYHYLTLSGKQINDPNEDVFKDSIHTTRDYDDSFKMHTQNKKTTTKEKKIKNVYLIKGKQLKIYGNNVVHGIVSVENIKKESKKYNVTITAYIASLLAYSIYEAKIKNRLDGKNMVVCIPVNLRTIFPSISLKNFFGVVNIQINTSNELTFENIIKIVSNEMKEKLQKEKLENFIYQNTKLENNILTKFIPLFIKNFVVNLDFELFEDKLKTLTLSNFGNIILPEDMKEYINHFEAVVYNTINSPSNVGLCSFDDKLSITFNRTIIETDIIKHFFQNISKVTKTEIYSNDFGV